VHVQVQPETKITSVLQCSLPLTLFVILCSKGRPLCIFMDDIFFHCPVPIGSLLLMSSQVYADAQDDTIQMSIENYIFIDIA